jgi:hypothetical protein
MSTPARRVLPGAVEIPGVEIQRGLRASDADRARHIAYLARCHEDGSIDGGVFTARMEAAAECITRDELEALTADLPPLAPCRKGIADRIRAVAGRSVLARRWAHGMGVVAALAWMIMLPTLIFTASGYPVTYKDGHDTWVQTEHPGAALAVMWLVIITGMAAVILSLVWWYTWENESE